MRPRFAVLSMLSLTLGGLIAATGQSAPPDDGVDSIMYQDPVLPRPKLVKTFPDGLLALWLQALDRPEEEFKARAALSIVQAHRRGLPGLQDAIGPLRRELARPNLAPAVVNSIVLALTALDARETAPDLHKLAETGRPDLLELIDPALAKWDYVPARSMWLARLDRPRHGRTTVLAIQALRAVREERALEPLRNVLFARGTPAAVRYEASVSLGELRLTGNESDAARLCSDGSDLSERLTAVSLLRRHSDENAVRLLAQLARDPEPAVATLALARLIELDPHHVVPMLDAVLANSDAGVRSNGVNVLRQVPSAAHLRLLGDRLNDPHPEVRVQARRALAELAGNDSWGESVLREGMRLLEGRDWRGQEQAALLLGRLDYKPASKRLVELLPSPRPEVQISSAWALRVLAVPETLAPALEHFRRAKGTTSMIIDQQLCQLVQLFGLTRYQPADEPLRTIIPLNSPPGTETRAAAMWTLGLLHEKKNTPAIARALEGRLRAVQMPDVDDSRVRRMAAISLARIDAQGSLPALNLFYRSRKPDLDIVNNACGWALNQMTGAEILENTIEQPQIDWFLKPVPPPR